MRSCLVVLLIALASTVSAGSIRPVACPTTTAEVKLVNPALTIWPVTAAGYQDYSATFYCSAVKDHAAQGIKIRNSKSLEEDYLAATPAEQAQVDVILKRATP